MDGKTGLWVAAAIAAIAGGWFALSQKKESVEAEKKAVVEAEKEAANAVKAKKEATVFIDAINDYRSEDAVYARKIWQAISPNSGCFLAGRSELKLLLEAIPTKKRYMEISNKYKSMYNGWGILDQIKDCKGIPRSQFDMYNKIVQNKPA